jgi:hypothetical protein
MSEADELYEMVNLVPRLTGLPMTVWAEPRGGDADHRRDRDLWERLTPGPPV